MIEADLKASLDAGLPDINGRVYPLVMPQDTAKNSVTYRILSSSEDTCMAGGVYGHRVHAQVDVWANSYLECVAMANLVSTALHADFTVSGLFTVDIYEDYTLRYRRVVDFRIL